jgi:UDP:flavonoid glycosyltransferase YjiC (YdhE family)
MIPVINRLTNDGNRVTLGGSGKSGKLLRHTFPDLAYISIPSVNIRYCGQGMWLVLSLIIQLPAMIFSAFREHHLLHKAVIRFGIDEVISDNRYGLYCRHTYNIIVTHQISPVLPRFFHWAEYLLYRFIRNRINRFQECWIPDYADANNLTGKLSHRFKLPENAKYIGILSRFSANPGISEIPEFQKYHLVIILSGPQPQLKRFSSLIIQQACKVQAKVLVITGLQDTIPRSDENQERLKIVPHLPPAEFRSALLQADTIICRSGYSSIMDLIALGKSAVLVPTPGQTEQEYLAQYLSGKKMFKQVSQSELDLSDLIQ